MRMKILKPLVMVFLLISTMSCSLVSSERDKFPYEMMIGLNDLPTGFEYGDSGFPEIKDATSYYLTYGRISEEIGALIRHQITIYKDVESAQNSYPDWEDQWFTDSWSTPDESSYIPHDPEDIYLLKCLPTQINERQSQACSLLQLHKNLVILVLTNIDSQNLSFAEFDEILRKLDARLPSDVVPLPPQ